ncbi:MAG: LysR family transcriptional regulator [Oscillibacter sp.]|nr:LysR family transcriptional regulator [Oscillibacter sp.]
MTLLQIKYFQSVCDYGGITRAADKLHISQPAVSNAIKELEREFGLRLFTKEGKSVQLTYEGTIFRDLCRQILSDSESAGRIMSDLARQNSQVRLGITPALALLYMPRLYPKFSAAHPDVSLRVDENEIQSLIEKLERRELDVVIMRDVPGLEKNYKKIRIATLEFVLCVSKKHRLADASGVTVKDLVDEPLIGFEQEFGQFSLPDTIFGESGLRANYVYRTNQISTIMGMVESGAMSSFNFRAIAERWEGICSIPLDPVNYQDVCLYWRNDGYIFHNMQKLIRCVQETELLER